MRALAGPGALVALLAAGNFASTHKAVAAAFGGATSSSADGPVQLHCALRPAAPERPAELAQLLSRPHARWQARATLERALKAGRARMDEPRHAAVPPPVGDLRLQSASGVNFCFRMHPVLSDGRDCREANCAPRYRR